MRKAPTKATLFTVGARRGPVIKSDSLDKALHDMRSHTTNRPCLRAIVDVTARPRPDGPRLRCAVRHGMFAVCVPYYKRSSAVSFAWCDILVLDSPYLF
ncbi:hypothetical protein EVAR_81948_1 [Eumeta japonica]|uniref:Uncharacterized protein n=1 Tax=Eumeta variegata TaxID=151549 RepID=A0A4C1ZFT2_EUMVA|nr:hypothetical protein EVAR_81948_1 [Eumeta japonica]